MLNIGFLVAVFFNVATPLCVALALVGAVFYFRGKNWLAALMLGLSMLAQENSAIVIAPLVLWLGWKKQWRSAFILMLSMVPWTIWQAALWWKYGTLPMFMSSGHFEAPFAGMIAQIASFRLPGGFIGNLRELSVYPFMAFVIALLVVSIAEMKKKPSELNLILIVHAVAGICFNNEQIWSSTITSPSRALATVFPFIVLGYARERSAGFRLLVIACLLLTLMGIFRILVLPVHPFSVTQ
jgi:hypothetical protein